MIDAHDHRHRRCPRLGSSVDFKYCRMNSESNPTCWKILDCWWETFDVRAFLMENLSEKDFERLIQARAPSKINSILDIVALAQSRKEKE
jgi:hypothetical protein